MGLRGPKPKSAELESAQGFPGRRKKQPKHSLAAAGEAESSHIVQKGAQLSARIPIVPRCLTKRARAIWSEICADPTTRLWFKNSDHRVIERYCFLLSEVERWTKKPPRPTYETTNADGDRGIKANPEYTQMLSVMREVRSIEQVIGCNPAARLNLEKNLRAPGEGDKPSSPRETAQASPKLAGPLGALRPARILNS